MLFNSLEFLVFFTVVVSAYFALPHRFRWILLLIASYWFYMSAKVEYGILLFISTFMGYVGALMIEKSQGSVKRKLWLWGSILANISMLFFFKYANFVGSNIKAWFGLFGLEFSPIVLKVVLPIGISFYTFQAISYTIDVFNRRIGAERHFGMYAVYHAFFPQLVAGPIERADHLLPQFYQEKKFDVDKFISGFNLILWGFFKKVVVADRLALLTTTIFGSPSSYGGLELLLAAVFFTFQIYCDFSGYSDIAVGSARIMGFELVTNFKRPFFSKSIAELWNRWHISLTKWFQDYVFIPLYLSLKERTRRFSGNAEVLHRVAFTLSLIIGWPMLGLWHGANWTFILYGWYMAFFIFMYYFTRAYWDAMHSLAKILATFAIFCFGNILFRASSVSDAIYIATHLFTGWGLNMQGAFIGLSWYGLWIAFLSIAIVLFREWTEEITFSFRWLEGKSVWKNLFMNTLLIVIIVVFGVFEKTPFIYFQF